MRSQRQLSSGQQIQQLVAHCGKTNRQSQIHNKFWKKLLPGRRSWTNCCGRSWFKVFMAQYRTLTALATVIDHWPKMAHIVGKSGRVRWDLYVAMETLRIEGADPRRVSDIAGAFPNLVPEGIFTRKGRMKHKFHVESPVARHEKPPETFGSSQICFRSWKCSWIHKEPFVWKKNSETSREHVNVSTLLEESTWLPKSLGRTGVFCFKGFYRRLLLGESVICNETRSQNLDDMTWDQRSQSRLYSEVLVGSKQCPLQNNAGLLFLFVIMDLSIGWRVNLSIFIIMNQQTKDLFGCLCAPCAKPWDNKDKKPVAQSAA